MRNVEHWGVVVDAQDYRVRFQDVERFLPGCKQCRYYGKLWSCPPFAHDVQAELDRFKSVFLLATRICYDEVDRKVWDSSERAMEDVMRPIFDSSWALLTRFYRNLEEQHPGSRAFTLRCRYCEHCSRPDGMPCRHPRLMRCSLESWGFDLGRTTSELLGIDLEWSAKGKLPDSLTLVTALFSPSELPQADELIAPLRQGNGQAQKRNE